MGSDTINTNIPNNKTINETKRNDKRSLRNYYKERYLLRILRSGGKILSTIKSLSKIKIMENNQLKVNELAFSEGE